MTLTTKVTWSSDEIWNIFVPFLVLRNCIVDIRITIISSTVHEIWRIDPYLTNFVKWLGLPRSRDLQRISKICWLDSLFFQTLYGRHQNNDYIVCGSRDMLIDPIWPTLSSDLDYQPQGHVIFKQNSKYICSIPCSLKLYSRHHNNDYIIYGSRDMADWPLFDQLYQVTLTSKVTWFSGNLQNMFAGFHIL